MYHFALLETERQNASHGAKVQVTTGLSSFQRLWESISLPFSASGDHLHSMACGLFLHLQSQQCLVSLSCCLLLTYLRTLVMTLGLPDNQDDLFILRTLIYNLNSTCNLGLFLPCSITHSQVPGIWTWSSSETMILFTG